MKNKLLAYLLVILLLFGLAGCTASNAGVASAIPDELKKAYDLQIANDELYKDCEANITVAQLCQLIQGTMRQMYQVDSLQVLGEVEAAFGNAPARRYDLVELLYLAEVERLYGYGKIEELKAKPAMPVVNLRPSFVAQRSDGSYGECSVWNSCTDIALIDSANTAGLVLPGRSAGFVDFFLRSYDATTGEKIITYNASQNFNPNRSVPVKEALLTMVKYYNSKLPEPEFVRPEMVGLHAIDKALYANAIALPNASNQQLPEWKGMLLTHQAWAVDGANGCDTEDIVLENDIRVLSECGFNFARIAVSFSRLQSANTLKGTVYPQDGTLNLRELEYLDQIISWGMKYGVHIQLVMFEVPGVDGNTPIDKVWAINDSIYTDAKLQQAVAEIWGALAKRYADIPNNYLSFNLMNEPAPPNDKAYVKAYLPAINAIRSAYADRVIVADIHSGNISGEEMAKQGVALSYHLYEPRDFCVPDMYLYAKNPSAFEKHNWPFKDKNGVVWDAETCLNKSDLPVTVLQLKKIAEENMVGFMIGEWGCFYNGEGGVLFPFAYTNEIREKFFTDMIQTLDTYDIGWSYGNYIGSLGLVTTYPVPNAGLTYEQIPGSTHHKVVENATIFKKLLLK